MTDTMRKSDGPWSGADSWALPKSDFGILDEATDRFSDKVLTLVALSRARTTPEQRRAIVDSVRAVNPPLRGGDPSFGDVVRCELVARGLCPADRALGGEELPFGPDREPL